MTPCLARCLRSIPCLFAVALATEVKDLRASVCPSAGRTSTGASRTLAASFVQSRVSISASGSWTSTPSFFQTNRTARNASALIRSTFPSLRFRSFHSSTPPHESRVEDESRVEEMVLQDHSQRHCRTRILTNVFSSRKNWQTGGRIFSSLEYFRKFYFSILDMPGSRVQAIVFHDGLPQAVLDEFATQDGTLRFQEVDLAMYDQSLGVNDVRLLLFRDQLVAHPEWDVVFWTDAADVMVKHDPCALVSKAPEKLYVASETDWDQTWVFGRFEEMGGRYLAWYEQQNVSADSSSWHQLYNAGVVGGKRVKMLELLDRLTAVLSDPELSARKAGRDVNVNMAALNWVLHNYFRQDIITGYPLQSRFKAEERRADVYFIHK